MTTQTEKRRERAEEEIRFWSKVDKSSINGCWLWIAYISVYGYGQFQSNGRLMMAHRWAYENSFGEIPKGLDCCHKCDVRNCVNPDHLFIGTRTDNMQDASKKGRIYKGGAKVPWTRLITHCKNGHELSDDNLQKINYSNPKYKNRRVCKICHKESQRKNWYKRSAKRADAIAKLKEQK